MEPSLLRACTTGGGLLQGGAGREQGRCSHGDTLHRPVKDAEPGARMWRRGPALITTSHPARLLEGFETSKRPGPKPQGCFWSSEPASLMLSPALRSSGLAGVWLETRMDIPGLCSVSVSVSKSASGSFAAILGKSEEARCRA